MARISSFLDQIESSFLSFEIWKNFKKLLLSCLRLHQLESTEVLFGYLNKLCQCLIDILVCGFFNILHQIFKCALPRRKSSFVLKYRSALLSLSSFSMTFKERKFPCKHPFLHQKKRYLCSFGVIFPASAPSHLTPKPPRDLIDILKWTL